VAETCRRQHNKVGYKDSCVLTYPHPLPIVYNTTGMLHPKSIIYSEYMCTLSYLACKAHAPYRHLWPVRLYNIFPPYLIKDSILGLNLLNIKYVVWYCLQLLC